MGEKVRIVDSRFCGCYAALYSRPVAIAYLHAVEQLNIKACRPAGSALLFEHPDVFAMIGEVKAFTRSELFEPRLEHQRNKSVNGFTTGLVGPARARLADHCFEPVQRDIQLILQYRRTRTRAAKADRTAIDQYRIQSRRY